jgi:signal transduction histidine kinase
VGVDVTEEEEMLRRLLRSERLAAVGTMAAGLAHEVRNPLNSASLQLTLLQRRLDRGESGAGLRPIADIIKSEIDRLDRLVRDFLAFSQPRPLEAQSVNAETLLSSLSQLITPSAEAVGVAISCELPPAPLAVAGDAERLRQVLLNLTRNALEAMQAGGGRRLTLRARPAGDAVELDVEDDGPGFGAELPVFDAFFTTKEHGTGLGLSIVHRIVADHGGTIRVQSRPGRTCFTLRLPAARRRAAP